MTAEAETAMNRSSMFCWALESVGLFTSKKDYLGMYAKHKVGYGWPRMIPSRNIQVLEAKCGVLSLLFNLASPHTNNVVIVGIFQVANEAGVSFTPLEVRLHFSC